MDYVNKNSHIAVVKNNDGTLQRLQAGEVVSADGAFADRLAATPGVQSATSADKSAWDSRNDTSAAENTSPTPSSEVNAAVLEARVAAQRLLAATNQLVIGDDQAPYGPPSGVVTTVDAVKDPEHFGPLSAAHVGSVEGDTAAGKLGGVELPTSAEVLNSQVEAHAAVDAVASQLAELHGGEPSDGEGDELSDLNGSEIDAELQARDLPKTGNVEERRTRLREAIAAEDGDDDDDTDE